MKTLCCRSNHSLFGAYSGFQMGLEGRRNNNESTHCFEAAGRHNKNSLNDATLPNLEKLQIESMDVLIRCRRALFALSAHISEMLELVVEIVHFSVSCSGVLKKEGGLDIYEFSRILCSACPKHKHPRAAETGDNSIYVDEALHSCDNDNGPGLKAS